MNTLDKHLADLRIYANELDVKLQEDIKSKPTLPPKKSKPPQPQIPQSCSVKSACEPSYTSRLEISKAQHAYSNINVRSDPPRTATRVRSADVLLYSNLLPPGGTNHIYTNIPSSGVISNGNSVRNDSEPLYGELRPPSTNVFRSYIPSSVSVGEQDFSTYGGSQTSSAYESLYEPIDPRPTSRLSGSSIYATCSRREEELYCGNCYECGERIIGETTGCTAMDHVYHIKCFRCRQCGIELQGKAFYAPGGRPLCEKDYMATLDKCCVCAEPILDRILRATGKPYHPQCFTCVVCRRSLDGIPFTVDAANRIHCIEDFHGRYAPRCARCSKPIVPESGEEETVRVVALDRSYHVRCYACEDCGVELASRQQPCYPLDGHLYCRDCNAARIQQLTRTLDDAP